MKTKKEKMISELSVIETKNIGSNCYVGEFSIIRHDVVLGNNVIIHPHVIVEAGVAIGDDVEIFPGTYIGKVPKGVGATARPISYNPKVSIGNNCAIGPNAVLYYDVVIGNNTLIGDGASLREQVRIGHHCLIGRYVTVNYKTIIGNHVRIMDLTHITGNCYIGNNVFISVLVSTTNDNIVVGREYEEEKIHGPHVNDGATIGAGACLLPGVTIGENAFIGSNAVVTRDVQPFDLVMGIPAKVVRNMKSSKD
jgi:acetyltransferase-like isoleucine patch superfamily enzyme